VKLRMIKIGSTAALLVGFLLLHPWSVADLAAMPLIQRITLPNKLVLLLAEEHSLPFVTIQMIIEAGSRLDPAGKEGLANLTARGLMLGTSKWSAVDLNETLDFMGAAMGVSASKDNASISLRVLKKDLEKGFGLFLDALTASTFPEEELKKEVKKILGAIQSVEEQPMEVAEQAFYKALFPDGPYGHPVEGSKGSVATLSSREVARFYKTHYHPNNAVLAVVGDITLEEVKTRLVPLLLNWPIGETAKPTFNPAFAKGPETMRINRDIAQANIIIGGIGIERANPDFYALTVMNYILGGGGFGSRLMDEIRVKRGLAYSVSSFFDAKKYSGSFQVVLQTKNVSAKEAISLALKQIEMIRQEPVSEEALRRAQNYLVGSFPLRFDTQGKLAGFLTQIEYYGLGLDYAEKYPALIKSISREDVLRVARKYLQPDPALRVVVGNLKEAGLETPDNK